MAEHAKFMEMAYSRVQKLIIDKKEEMEFYYGIFTLCDKKFQWFDSVKACAKSMSAVGDKKSKSTKGKAGE